MCAFSGYEFYVLIFISVLEGGAEVAQRVGRSPSLEVFKIRLVATLLVRVICSDLVVNPPGPT